MEGQSTIELMEKIQFENDPANEAETPENDWPVVVIVSSNGVIQAYANKPGVLHMIYDADNASHSKLEEVPVDVQAVVGIVSKRHCVLVDDEIKP